MVLQIPDVEAVVDAAEHNSASLLAQEEGGQRVAEGLRRMARGQGGGVRLGSEG